MFLFFAWRSFKTKSFGITLLFFSLTNCLECPNVQQNEVKWNTLDDVIIAGHSAGVHSIFSMSKRKILYLPSWRVCRLHHQHLAERMEISSLQSWLKPTDPPLHQRHHLWQPLFRWSFLNEHRNSVSPAIPGRIATENDGNPNSVPKDGAGRVETGQKTIANCWHSLTAETFVGLEEIWTPGITICCFLLMTARTLWIVNNLLQQLFQDVFLSAAPLSSFSKLSNVFSSHRHGSKIWDQTQTQNWSYLVYQLPIF